MLNWNNHFSSEYEHSHIFYDLDMIYGLNAKKKKSLKKIPFYGRTLKIRILDDN